MDSLSENTFHCIFYSDLEEGGQLIISRLILGIELSNEASFFRLRATAF